MNVKQTAKPGQQESFAVKRGTDRQSVHADVGVSLHEVNTTQDGMPIYISLTFLKKKGWSSSSII